MNKHSITMNSTVIETAQETTLRLLNPMTMPLVGRSVIEASAGTGKTFTITTLYVRLLLGLDNDGLPPLTVDQLLVMTFTEAATEEIRDRVRRRLQDVKNALLAAREPSDSCTIATSSNSQQLAEKPSVDPVLVEILAKIDEPAVAFGRIDVALKSLDEAAIFTIHGFCHRMLQQHAFESRSLFEETFIMDETELLQRVTRDYWRRQVPQQQGLVLEVLQSIWQHPDDLLREIRGLLSRQFATILPSLSWENTLNTVATIVTQIQQIKRTWRASDMASLLADSDLKANAKAKKPEQLQAMQAFCESTKLRPGKLDLTAWSVEVLSKPSMLKGAKKPPQHPVFDLISDYLQASASIEQDIRAAFLQQALSEVSQRRAEEKQRLHYLSPDDLLTRLATALSADEQGALAGAIRRQFPAMMIDEFQDTDPLQYHIVDSIYPQQDLQLSKGCNQTPDDSVTDVEERAVFSVIMIGDPKQAIYGFRGADIFTYIHAKRAVNAEQRYTLGTNWRSSAPMVNAVNQLFSTATQGFLYQDDIPFQPVKAANLGKHQQFQIGQETAASMHVWHIEHRDGPLTQTQNKQLATQQLVAEIVRLLHQGEVHSALIAGKPLVASDMAVLVRDRNEAKLVREALREAGVGSVFITRQSVFDSDFSLNLYQLLNAIYQEKNERSIRALLVGTFFGYGVQQVLQLNDDESRWQHLLQKIQQWKQRWLRYGVLAMLHQILIDNTLANVWRSKGLDVERLLTDYRHLGELLQEKSMQVEGPHRLLNWFRQQLQAEQQSEGFRLRLESDEKLIQIVTWHASKGLEYPIVFLPFAVNYRESKDIIFHQDDGLVLDLSPASTHQVSAQKEQLAEDIRLLYVALTRPVYRCYLGIYDLKYGRGKRSVLPMTALGSLLNLDPDESEQTIALQQSLVSWQQAVNKASGNALVIETIDAQALENQPVECSVQGENTANSNERTHDKASESESSTTDTRSSRTFSGQINRDWHVTSYSALSHNAASTHIQPGGTDEQSASRLAALSEVDSQASRAQSIAFIPVSHEQSEAVLTEPDTHASLPLDDESTSAKTEGNLQAMDSDALGNNAENTGPSAFPRGANAGSCLHYILENIDFTQADTQLPPTVVEALTTYGIDPEWSDVAIAWMHQVLNTPLLPSITDSTRSNASSVSEQATAVPTLSAISASQRLVEMEFFLPMQRITSTALSRIVQQHLREISPTIVGSETKPISPFPQLHFSPVQGVLKGFIDLIFCFNGQYYVLDYKSNWLAEDPREYLLPAMHDAMLSHHYHLQYLLYVLALHRFLSQRLSNYSYEKHVGGAVYAFLRGMQGDEQHTGIYFQRPSWDIVQQLDALFAGDIAIKPSKKAQSTHSKADDNQLSLWDEDIAETPVAGKASDIGSNRVNNAKGPAQ